MIRYTLLSTAAAVGLAFSTSAFADNPTDAQQLVNDSVQTVHEIRKDPHFADMLQQAKGVFILPSLVKGAAIVGGQGGQGVLLAHENGTWSDPAFLSIGSISIGAQAGGAAGPVVMLLMTNKALSDLTQANNFSLNGNAGLTVVTYSAHGQAPVGKGDIIIWSNTSGAYGGVNVSGTDITSNANEDRNFYGHKVSTSQIIHGKANNPAADPLRNALPT